MCRLFSVAPILLWLITSPAFAQLPSIASQPLPGGGQSWSLPVQTPVFITSLTFIPAVLLMMTGFTHVTTVFNLLHSALGTPSTPPNQVLPGLALFLIFFIMSPVVDKIYVDMYQPFSEEKISIQGALEKGAQPLRESMLHQTREADLGLFARLANTSPLQGPEAVPIRILLPACMTSELKTALQVGFTIFTPFLITDLVIVSVLMVLGMMIVPPATVALPFKLMLLMLVGGWRLLVGSLVQSFYNQKGKMTPGSVMMIRTKTMKAALVLTAPLLLVALATGLVVSTLQATTQISETTLSFIPKIIAVSTAITITGPWVFDLLLDCVRILFANPPYIIGQPVQ